MAERTTLKDAVRQAVFRSLLANGYDGTSFQVVSDAVGKTRAHVQYHFPKKTAFATEFLGEVMGIIDVFLRARGLNMREDPLAYLHVMAQVFYHFLLGNEACRRFTAEFLSSREITAEVLAMETDWVFGEGDFDEFTAQDVVVATGGVYELLYQELNAGIVPNANRAARRTTIGCFVLKPDKIPAVAALCDELQMTDAELSGAVRFIFDELDLAEFAA